VQVQLVPGPPRRPEDRGQSDRMGRRHRTCLLRQAGRRLSSRDRFCQGTRTSTRWTASAAPSCRRTHARFVILFLFTRYCISRDRIFPSLACSYCCPSLIAFIDTSFLVLLCRCHLIRPLMNPPCYSSFPTRTCNLVLKQSIPYNIVSEIHYMSS
jgi:hypothetical protein